MPASQGKIASWLATAPKPAFVVYAIAAAFATYFCMYAFRKPFAAARFEGQHFLGGDIASKRRSWSASFSVTRSPSISASRSAPRCVRAGGPACWCS